MDLVSSNPKTIMKTSILVPAIIASVLLAPVASANEETVSAEPATNMSLEEQISQLQGNMKQMEQQLEKFRTTTDPKERRKLLQEHIQTMQESMNTMHGMGGPPMGCDQRVEMAKGRHKDEVPDDMMKHHEMMEKRMDMLQMLID